MTMQLSLFGRGAPSFDPELGAARRLNLGDGAWVDHLPGWLDGHDDVFRVLRDTTRWRALERTMYDRVVEVPRLLARLPQDGPGHPVLGRMKAALTSRYGVALDSVSLALYRDGRDSVAWHGDRLGPVADEAAVVAALAVGAPRRFLLRPRSGGRSLAFELGFGDLLVMGGACQQTWEHAVPKVASAGPRISVQFRPVPPEAPQERVRSIAELITVLDEAPGPEPTRPKGGGPPGSRITGRRPR